MTMKNGRNIIIGTVLGLVLPLHAFLSPTSVVPARMASSTSSSLDMNRRRGLERREEGATPMRKLMYSSGGQRWYPLLLSLDDW